MPGRALRRALGRAPGRLQGRVQGLTSGRWRLVRVVGESMRPTLRPGDVLLLRSGRLPRVGDLVVAELPGGRRAGVKRAVRREPGGWWLERDSPTVGTDSWLFGAVPDGDVLGVVQVRLWRRPGRLPPGRRGTHAEVPRRSPDRRLAP